MKFFNCGWRTEISDGVLDAAELHGYFDGMDVILKFYQIQQPISSSAMLASDIVHFEKI